MLLHMGAMIHNSFFLPFFMKTVLGKNPFLFGRNNPLTPTPVLYNSSHQRYHQWSNRNLYKVQVITKIPVKVLRTQWSGLMVN